MSGQLLPEETLLMNAARTQAATAAVETLTALSPGMSLPYGGNKFTRVPDQVAAAFQPGDHLLVVQTDGAILHIPAAQYGLVAQAVAQAQAAFVALRAVSDAQIEGFYDSFARRLQDEAVWTRIAAANTADVAAAQARGRSTTRLLADERMRRRMIAGWRSGVPCPHCAARCWRRWNILAGKSSRWPTGWASSRSSSRADPMSLPMPPVSCVVATPR